MAEINVQRWDSLNLNWLTNQRRKVAGGLFCMWYKIGLTGFVHIHVTFSFAGESGIFVFRNYVSRL
ncbi:hypothetical protein J32TS6_11680 [Virgibacillus pantothenticus]|uniref:Uncharacterized protein n=1 Tax=Virgibacillus pantothenticus TaxID=1473 RepID=A0A0L0QLZ5_VIRPA|nr:hypothetical protein AFK71_13660 [Virgibacillus pantothenticus]GIP62613.1 hypothetical protein J32TS6_11680 [Virgibacillus pantothenticus]